MSRFNMPIIVTAKDLPKMNVEKDYVSLNYKEQYEPLERFMIQSAHDITVGQQLNMLYIRNPKLSIVSNPQAASQLSLELCQLTEALQTFERVYENVVKRRQSSTDEKKVMVRLSYEDCQFIKSMITNYREITKVEIVNALQKDTQDDINNVKFKTAKLESLYNLEDILNGIARQ